MNKSKKFKDPIYGYIDIPNDLIYKIIDSPPFQRLRRIVQTSYAPLYSSAVHNRFVHSLGVYHLGRIAGETLSEEIARKIVDDNHAPGKDMIYRLSELFTVACLLHDIGHAPFSHTGEFFYLGSNSDPSMIHEDLKEIVGNEFFSKDVPIDKSNAALPHEIMSAIIGLREFTSVFDDSEEKSFFARCITGYKYSVPSVENSIRDCFISLLNSKVIDVDKLDYLIRDAYITGFDTVKIDFYRLLTSLTIVSSSVPCEAGEEHQTAQEEENCYELAYYKGAFSVIENVVFAHDAEKKWIQSHPVILYESYILRHIMKMLSEKLDSPEARLFSLQSLSVQGHALGSGDYIRLISDDDIVFLMKKYYEENQLVREFFDRRSRRHPIWKSEAEYKALFLDIAGDGKILNALEKAMENTAEYLSKSADSWLINKELVETLKREIDEMEANPDLKHETSTLRTQRTYKNNILKLSDCLTRYADDAGYAGDFILIKASQFNSGFLKPDFSRTKIVFPSNEGDVIGLFSEKISSYGGIGASRNNFFYLFYDRNANNGRSIDINQLCKCLIREFI